MDEDDTNTNLTIDTSSTMTIPIIEESEKLFSSMSTNLNRDIDNEKHLSDDKSNENLFIEETHSHSSNLDSESNQSQSQETIVFDVLNQILNDIETDINMPMNSLPIIEDDQMDVEEDEDDEEENDDEEDDDEQDNSDKSTTIKLNKIDKERTTNRTLTLKTDLKPTTRTLRSHARKKSNLTNFNSNLSSTNNNNNTRRVSNRRRALENKLLLNAHEKEKRRRTLTERIKKDKDPNDDNHVSSNSDDQTTESAHGEKYSNPNDDFSSCSSAGAGDGGGSSSSTTSSTAIPVKQSTDMECLPPNKRRLREKNHTTNVTESSEQSPNGTTTTREIPMNGIKQFLEIRQQIDKRHETMLNEFVLPKIPKDFAETTMAKKSYLVASTVCSYVSTTPASIGIKRYAPPQDLDLHLAEVFSKQEDERYRMKLRHQVERDKLILSHEQEVLRLCGNATRSSVNQEIPFSYCSLLKDNEVYNNPSIPLPEKLLNNDYSSTELGKRGKHRWNGRSFIKWLEDSNLKYKRLSCELNERQRLEADTLYSMQRMVWLKHLPKEASNLSSSNRSGYLLSERYLPKVEINPNFWTNWETNPF